MTRNPEQSRQQCECRGEEQNGNVRMLTGVCQEVGCNYPSSLTKALEFVDHRDQRSADDGGLEGGEEHAETKASI
jgi:hypothetical protein